MVEMKGFRDLLETHTSCICLKGFIHFGWLVTQQYSPFWMLKVAFRLEFRHIKSRVFNEISGMTILFRIVYWKYNLVIARFKGSDRVVAPGPPQNGIRIHRLYWDIFF
jgi:hypothetical protein